MSGRREKGGKGTSPTMRDQIAELEREREKIINPSDVAEAVSRQHARGKLTARERIGSFFDGDAFHELGMWANPRITGF
ncbi:MAG: methylmalonyl-CoA carboxyltransferase, partial [Deltaproteobacteria bacterium]|nr:methylmalonyl-CoA carboxyltransferase [Deltaproteobacteria bacterium]